MGSRLRARSFEGSRVLLTGAASGIGRALARDLARRGARLALADIDARGLESVAREIAAGGVAPSIHVVDLADADAVEALARDALAALGHVDLLVNNAGVAVVSSFAQTTASDWRWVMDVNLWGPIRLTQAILPSMLARGSGRIVITASLAGLLGAPGMVAYSTTKFAIVGFAESLRHELVDRGIGVTLVCPGYVRTGLHAATRYRNRAIERFLSNPPRWYGLSAERTAELAGTGVHVMTAYPGMTDTPMTQAGLDAYGRKGLVGMIPLGDTATFARRLRSAVLRRKRRLIYPRFYALARWFPRIAGWFSERLAPRLPAPT